MNKCTFPNCDCPIVKGNIPSDIGFGTTKCLKDENCNKFGEIIHTTELDLYKTFCKTWSELLNRKELQIEAEKQTSTALEKVISRQDQEISVLKQDLNNAKEEISDWRQQEYIGNYTCKTPFDEINSLKASLKDQHDQIVGLLKEKANSGTQINCLNCEARQIEKQLWDCQKEVYDLKALLQDRDKMIEKQNVDICHLTNENTSLQHFIQNMQELTKGYFNLK